MGDVTDDSPLRPSTETNVLLGQLMAKVDALAGLATVVADLKADVAVLKAQQAPRLTVGGIIASLSGILGAVATTVALVVLFTK